MSVGLTSAKDPTDILSALPKLQLVLIMEETLKLLLPLSLLGTYLILRLVGTRARLNFQLLGGRAERSTSV